MGTDSRIRTLTKHLRAHDSLLYATSHKEGRIDVYRKSSLSSSPPHLVFPLTENWTLNSRPVEWGIEVILARINAHDLWRDDCFLESISEANDKVDEGKERDRRNNTEAFLYDFKSQFARATNDVNTSCLDKFDRRREKETNFYGNY